MRWTTKDQDSTEAAARFRELCPAGADPGPAPNPVFGDAVEQRRCLLDDAHRRDLDDGHTVPLATADAVIAFVTLCGWFSGRSGNA